MIEAGNAIQMNQASVAVPPMNTLRAARIAPGRAEMLVLSMPDPRFSANPRFFLRRIPSPQRIDGRGGLEYDVCREGDVEWCVTTKFDKAVREAAKR